MHLGQNLEATVEQQLRVWITRLDCLEHTHHAGFLTRAVGVGLGHEMVRIERVEEKAAIAAFPQRRDYLVDIEGRPAVGGLIDDSGVPCVIAAGKPGLGDVLEVRAARQDFADADICEPGGVWCFGATRIEAAIGLHDGHVEGLQHVHGWAGAIVKCHARRDARRRR
jgi:hypothetical protein